MRRYWLEPKSCQGTQVIIDGETFHHIFDVCRQEQGDKFEVLFGDGKAHLVEVTSIEKKRALCVIQEERDVAPIQKPYIHLCVSVPRFAVFEAVLEKAVELGAFRVHLYFSDFSFVKNAREVSESRMERWKKIVRSATQQSGRGDLMALEAPVALSDLLKTFNQSSDAVGLFCYEGEGQKDIKAWASEAKKSTTQSKPTEIWAFIGSEGGFSSNEIERFQALKLPPVTLGNQVLRVETACVAIMSVLKYEWDLFK